MIISIKNKFIFIHTFKTGGSSIQHALNTIGAGQVDKFGDLEISFHSRAYWITEIMGKELFDSLFSFAFVRNPWDIQYSLYKYMLRNKKHHRHEEIIKTRNFEHYLKLTYYKFLERRYDNGDDLDMQMSFVCDKDSRQIVKYIGRFENLNNDFDYILNEIGFDPKKIKLPHHNKSTQGDYRLRYNSKMVDWVAEMHERDIKFFGYIFE